MRIFYLESPSFIISGFGWLGTISTQQARLADLRLEARTVRAVRGRLLGGSKAGALAARVFVGAKGYSNLPPRAQRGFGRVKSQRWRALTLL